MKKIIILILFIFALSYAQNFDDDAEVETHYYQILLKKWQNSGSYQEFNPLSSTLEELKNLREWNSFDFLSIPLKGYDGWGRGPGGIKRLGRNLEYYLIRIRGLPENDQMQMWILVSIPLKKVIATYKDKIKPDMPVKDSCNSRQNFQDYEACYFYLRLLTKWKLDIQFEKYSPLPWEWWKDTDSVTAVSIAINTARERYGQEMAALTPRLMGNNDEFWLVYCFPSIQFEKRISSCEDHLVWRYEKGRLVRPQTYIDKEPDCYKKFDNLMSKTNELGWCYYSIMRRYEDARLYWASSDCMEKPPDCFQLIVVLISKADGQVLYTEENKRSPHECATYEERVQKARKLFDLK